MTARPRAARAATVAALVLAALPWAAASRAATAAPPTATVGGVVCADDDGTVAVTLTAGDVEATFTLWVDDDRYGDDDTVLAAGQSTTVTVTGLDDDDHTVEVELDGDPDAEVDPTVLASVTRTVACDPAPVGTYTNVRGDFPSDCDAAGVLVRASNKPIGGNTADLQPVEFTLVFEKFVEVPGTDEPGEDPGEDPGDGEEPGDGDDGGDGGDDPVEPRLTDDPVPVDPDDGGPETEAPVTLATFTLGAGTPTYERVFSFAELGGFGHLTLSVGTTVVASTDYYGVCVDAAAGSGTGYGVAATGA